MNIADLCFEAAKPNRAFVDSIRTHGVLHPLLVSEQHDGTRQRFIVRDGRRRATAAKQAGMTQVPVQVVEASALECDAWTIVANLHRSRNVSSELKSLRALLSSGGDRESVEAVLGLYRNDAKRLFALLSLVPQAEALLSENRLSPSTALVIAGLSAAHQRQFLAEIEPCKPTLSAAKAFRLRVQFAPRQLAFLADSIPSVSTTLT